MEAKAEVFKKLEQLTMILTPTSAIKNRCWWDTQPCLLYSEFRGLREADGFCIDCNRVDGDELCSIIKKMAWYEVISSLNLEDVQNVSGYKEALKEREEAAKETGRKEGINEAYREICEYLDEFLEKLKKSRNK